MLFSEPTRYYEDSDGRYYQQGDIVLAPVAHVRAGALAEIAATAAGEFVRRQLWSDMIVGASSSDVTAEALLCPAMITAHDCALDKDFNRRYRELRRAGATKADAEEEAGADPHLDPLLTVVPVVPYADAAPSLPDQLTRNEVIGFFPVCESPERSIDAGVADLMSHTTIERHAIVDRLGILSQAARATLRYALARFWVYRAPSLTFDVEQAIGKRIRDYRLEHAGDLALVLELDDGSELRLLQAPAEAGGGPERPPVTESA